MGILELLYHYTHYAAHGGSSYNSTYCGIFFISDSVAFSYASWDCGAALSFRFKINR